MITPKTVFILGAGAHCSYNFPSGEKLKKEIVKSLERDQQKFMRLAALGHARIEDVQPENISKFANSLALSGQASIDAFLNAHSESSGYEAIGKFAIAEVLLKYENQEELFKKENEDDWLSYLFKEMLNGVHHPGHFLEINNVSFITFNYDRTLEHWLKTKIQNSFALSDENSLKALQRIPIFHVYGQLGPYPRGNRHKPDFDLTDSHKNIRLIHEAQRDVASTKKAKELIYEADVICLLGFGFHRENIELLDLHRMPKNIKPIVTASRYGITDTEWDRILRLLPLEPIVASNAANLRCLETLRNTPTF